MMILRNLNENYDGTFITNDEVKKVAIKFVREHGFDKNVVVSKPTRNNGIGWYPHLEHGSDTVYDLHDLFHLVNDHNWSYETGEDDFWGELGYQKESEDPSKFYIETYMCTDDEYRTMDQEINDIDPEQTINPNWYNRCLQSWNKTGGLDQKDVYNICSLINYVNKQHEHTERVRQRQIEKERREQEHADYVGSDQNSFAGDIGDTISFVVASVKEIYGQYGIIYQLTGTDGRHYTVASTKLDSVDVGDTITGKVKSLSEFRGIKETRLRFVSQRKAN